MHQESGRSMVEIIGVIAIMTLISAGAFVLIRSGMAAQKRSVIVDDVSKIVSGVRSLYVEYDSLPSNFDSAGILAAVEVDSTGPNGATYSVAKSTSDNTNTQFVISIGNLSSKDCVTLGKKVWADSISHTDCSNNTITITYAK